MSEQYDPIKACCDKMRGLIADGEVERRYEDGGVWYPYDGPHFDGVEDRHRIVYCPYCGSLLVEPLPHQVSETVR